MRKRQLVPEKPVMGTYSNLTSAMIKLAPKIVSTLLSASGRNAVRFAQARKFEVEVSYLLCQTGVHLVKTQLSPGSAQIFAWTVLGQFGQLGPHAAKLVTGASKAGPEVLQSQFRELEQIALARQMRLKIVTNKAVLLIVNYPTGRIGLLVPHIVLAHRFESEACKQSHSMQV